MKFGMRDFAKLLWPLLTAITLLVMAILLALWSIAATRQANNDRNKAAASSNQIENRLRQVRTEEEEIKDRAALFHRLEKSGLTGEEKRLDWLEQLRDLQRELRLPGINYEFGAQTPLENVTGAAYAYHASTMRIQLNLLHEKDLLDFLERLQKEAKALVIVRSCKLSRQANRSGTSADMATLNAECEMDWITLRRSTGSK